MYVWSMVMKGGKSDATTVVDRCWRGICIATMCITVNAYAYWTDVVVGCLDV